MTERKASAFNWELILASAPTAKGVCHFNIKDIFKGNKALLFCDGSPVMTTAYFQSIKFFWRDL